MRRDRNAKIVATLGPASSSPSPLLRLATVRGAGVRVDFSVLEGDRWRLIRTGHES